MKMKDRWHRYDKIDLGLDMDTNILNIKIFQYEDAYMN